MPITYARDPSGLEGRGTVWLSADEDGGWFGYWDLEPDGPPEPLEQGPGWQSAQDAVAWGRSRARRVFIRLEWNGGYWWAGDGPPPEDLDPEGMYRG